LEIVRDGDVAGSDVTVIDVRSGARHVLTADEFCLCRAADGTNTLAAIRQAFKAETSREILHGKVFAFFRRLRSLGLLEGSLGLLEESVAEKSGPVATIAGDIQGVTEPHSGGTTSPSTPHDKLIATIGPDRGRNAATLAAEQPATDSPDASTADIAESTPISAEGATVPPAEPAAPSDSDAAGFGRNKRRARRQRLMQSRRLADKSSSLRTSAEPISNKAAETGKSETPMAAQAIEAVKPGAPEIGEDFEDLESLGLLESDKTGRPASRLGIRRRRRDAGRVKAGGQASADGPTAAASPGGPVDPWGAGDFAAALGGGMGAGGFGGMLGGGRQGRGGAAVQNFLAGVAARARQGAEADANEPARVSLFNPNTVLGLLAASAWPLKYVFVPLLLVVPAAVWITYQQRQILAQNISAFDVSVVGTVILALAIANLICRLVQGTFIRGFGAEVKQFGIALTFAIPRFFVDLGGIATLDRRGQLWVHAAPLIARLGLFCSGTLLWFALRQSAPWPAHLALVVGQIGLLAFLLSALPLLPSNGYRWLATYFGRPALRSDALASMPGRRSEESDDSDAVISASSAVTFYVVAVALAVSVLALVVQAYFDVATTGDVQLLTASIMLGVCVALAAWVIALWNYGRGHKIEALDPDAAQQLLATWTGVPDIASDRPVSIGAVGKVFWAVVLSALIAVAFLPYRYEAAGAFEILPTQKTTVTVRTAGQVEQVLVREGDWVKANQALAKLSSDDQQREITITRAELDRAKAQLAQFGGNTTAQEGDPGLEALNQSIADALKDEADSTSIKKDPTGTSYFRTQAERAARAEVERLTRKLAYERDQLADTTVRAATEGRVVTPNVHLLTGRFLRRGAALLSLDDTRTLEAEINVPEADIGLVKVGEKVRLRPWSDEDREIVGAVTEIAPAAQARRYGTVVRVSASIPNQEAFLRPSMTGYAKIDGEDMRVWEAFLGRIIRIVRVEMWSWIP